MVRLAANVSTLFQELPFLERFDAAADAGFDAAECQFPYGWPADAVAARLARSGLQLAMFNMPAGDLESGEFGFAALADRKAQLRAGVQTAIDYALATGTKRLHLLAGCGDAADPAARQVYVSSLAWAADQLAKHGLMLLIEPLNRRDRPGYFLGDFGLAEEIIVELARPSLKLQFDVYHRQLLHGDVTAALRRLMPIIGHVQVASVPDRHEPGTGELDDFRLFRALDAIGYDGFVGCEYVPAGSTREGLAWLGRWREAEALAGEVSRSGSPRSSFP
ncbi:MAG TPA: TIM barrel protein [Allosphingosinicella sp.]|nr:TIM barrel protein [Allosphingosinicella sp.]